MEQQRTVEIVLKYYREKYDLKQEEICDGLCSVTTLSRIEQGFRESDSLVVQALLSRIGKEVTLFETIVNEEDYDLWKTRTEIEKLVERKQFAAAKKKINAYRKMMPEEETTHEQFCLYQEACVLKEEGKPDEEVCDVLERAIKLTIPKIGTKTEKARLYSQMEIKLIFQLYQHHREEEMFLEQEILNVIAYVEKYYGDRNKEKIQTELYLAIIRYQEQKHNYEIILEYIEKLLQVIAKGEGFYHLAELYFLRARLKAKMAVTKADWEQCKKDCRLACGLYEIEEDEKGQNAANKYYEELEQDKTVRE